MKKKKVEKVIFHMLYVLPFLMVMTYWLWSIVYANNHESTLTISSLYDSFISVFDNTLLGFVYTPINYFLVNVMSLGSNLSSIISLLIQYWVIVELVVLLYRLVVFIPRALCSIIDSGLGDN